MATTYNTAFGSLPGYNELLGTTNTTGGGQQQTYGAQTTSTTQPQAYQAGATFAQMQKAGMARPPAPTAPQAQPFAQYGGSQQAQQMRQRLQEQLQTFGQAPSRFDTQAFQQIRGAQAANLQQEYRGQQQALNEELARRGLSASSVGGGRMGDLAGQQARALADLDARLLQQAAETQAQDRAQLLAAGQGLAELAGSQDLAQFEANRVAQAAAFENELRAAQFGQQQYQQYGQEAFQAAQAEEAARQAQRQFGLQATGQAATLSMDLQRLLGQQEIERAGLTGLLGEDQTLAARQFELQQELQRAGLTGRLGTGAEAQDTLAAQQQQFQQKQSLFQQAQQLSEQSGVQYTVDENNRIVPLRDAQGNVIRTSAFTQAEEARKQQQAISTAELQLRRQLGLMEATGQGLTVDAEGRIIAGTGATAQTLQARQVATQERQLAFQNAARLSEQSGVQYTVDDKGQVVPLRDAQGNPVKTSAETQATEARKQQQEQFNIQQFGAAGTPTASQQTLAALQQQLQQAGITGTYQGRLTQDALQNAYVRAAQLTQETGIRHTVNPTTGEITAMTGTGASTLEAQLRQAGITGTFAGALTQQALQDAYARAAQLSQITGQQYTVNQATGALTAATGDTGRTFAAQLQAAGITGQFGGGLTQDALQNAYQRAAQLSQITGKQYTVNPATGAITEGTAGTLAAELQKAGLTGTLDGKSTLERLQQNLQNAQVMSQITGKQYTVDKDGNLVPAGTGAADTEARRQFDLDKMLRQALGMSEATGYVYDPITGQMTAPKTETVQGQIARSQTLLSLASALGNLTPEQIANLLGRGTPTTQGSDNNNPTTTTRATADDPNRLGQGQQDIPQTITFPDSPQEGWLYNIGGTLVRYRSGKYYRMDGSVYTPGGTPPTTTPPGPTTTTSGQTTTTASPFPRLVQGWPGGPGTYQVLGDGHSVMADDGTTWTWRDNGGNGSWTSSGTFA